MRTTRTRASAPLIFRAADGLGANGKLVARSYGTELEGVFARAGAAHAVDQNGVLALVPHSLPRLSVVGGEHVLLLEGPGTNYLLRSQEFDNAAWSATNTTVTANQAIAPDGTLTADKVEAATATPNFRQIQTTIATTLATFSVYGKIGSGATDCNFFALKNETVGGAPLSYGTINWSTGVVTVTAGSMRAEALGNGWYRIILTATSGFTSGDDISCFVGFNGGGGETIGEHAYFWGAQLEAAEHPSSYIPTTSAAASRVADSLYLPFQLPPLGLTVYSRHIELGTALGATDRALWSIGGDANAALFLDGGSGDYTAFLRLASDTFSSPTHTVAFGDIVETRVTLASTGAVTCHVTLNAGTEATGSASAAATLPSAWNLARFYLGSRNSVPGPAGITHACIDLGAKTRAEMRALAEVA